MDPLSIAAVATEMAAIRTQHVVQLTMLKKAMALQAQGALALIQAVPQPPAAPVFNNPPHLGNRLDRFA